MPYHGTTQPAGAGCASLPATEGVAAGLFGPGHQCLHTELRHLLISPAQFCLAPGRQGES